MRRVQMGLIVRSSREGLSTRFQRPSFLNTLSTSALRSDLFFEKDQTGAGPDSAQGIGGQGSSDAVPSEIYDSLRRIQEQMDRGEKAGGHGNNNAMPKGYPFRPPPQPKAFEVTSEQVLRKADFRNARFLANFMTEGGIMVKRRHTGISAKAQRRVAREIKTARSFGLLPFTTQGTKSFKFGNTMANQDHDYSGGGGGGGQ